MSAERDVSASRTEAEREAWAQLDSVLVYLWSTTGSRRGANGRQSQIDYGKRQAHAAVEQILAERDRRIKAEALREAIAELSDGCEAHREALTLLRESANRIEAADV